MKRHCSVQGHPSLPVCFVAAPETSIDRPAAPSGANPLFSFVLICWNHERFVADTLQSISSQDYPNWECLAIDNGSTDGSRSLIERHVTGDSRFRLLARPENHGQLAAALDALDRISGEFVCIVDSDDLLFPNFASAHVAARLAEHHRSGVSSGRIVEIDSGGAVLSGAIRPFVNTPACGQRKKAAAATFRAPLNPGTSNVFARSDLLLARLLAPDRLEAPQAADNLFFRAAHMMGGSLLIETPLSAYRITGTNVWATQPAMLGFNRVRPEVEKIFLRQMLEQAAKFVLHGKEILGTSYRERFWPSLYSLTGGSEAQAMQRFLEPPLKETLAAERDTLIRDFGEEQFKRFCGGGA